MHSLLWSHSYKCFCLIKLVNCILKIAECIQFSGIKYTHIVVQPSPPSISRTFFLLFKFTYLFLRGREREREHELERGRERGERESQAGSSLSAQSPMRALNL